MATTLITGGTVVTATGRSEADVLIDGETIVGVLNPGSVLLGSDLASSVDHVIDAAGYPLAMLFPIFKPSTTTQTLRI